MGWEEEERRRGRRRGGGSEGGEVVRRRKALLIVGVCEVPDCTHVFVFLNVHCMYVLGQCRTLWGEHE